MYRRIVLISFAFIIILNVTEGRRQKKTYQPKEEENPAPQPTVLTYSTFGFNDVGSYDGFVPTSPDYATYLDKYKKTSEKLYAPAFPSAPDNDFSSNSQFSNGEPFSTGNSGQQSSMLRYNNVKAYSSSNYKSDVDIGKNSFSEIDHSQNSMDTMSPVYGSKIGSTNKNTLRNGYNNTEINNVPSYQSDHKISNYQESHSLNENRPSYDMSNSNKQNFYNYATTNPSNEVENSMKASPINDQSSLKYTKLEDFINKQPYDTMVSENKYSAATVDTFKSMPSSVNDDTLSYFEDQNNRLIKISPSFKNTLDAKDSKGSSQKENFNSYQGYTSKHIDIKNKLKNKKINHDYIQINKDEVKVKLRAPDNFNNDRKRVKNDLNGYEYANNYSNTHFQLGGSEPKKQYHNIDEIIPSSSNIIDFSRNHFQDNDYLNLDLKPATKNIYNLGNNEEFTYNIGNKYNPSADYLSQFQSLYSTVPTTSTSWGNIFKSSEHSAYKTHISKPQYTDEDSYDTVQINKRPYNYRYGKDSDSVANDWSEYNKRPTKYNRQKTEWNAESFNNRFKSEEDLLGLRNHDTSHPSYLPAFKYPGNEEPEESFKKTVEKWRENYIKTKYRDTPAYDYEASEAHNVHALNPYHIQVPHPVIVPVPQPYPIRVPVPKPVAVPVIQEITVPIEKPVPYPVYKKVPYPVEKLVPVPVEKQVPVPVAKPYPVMVPQVRPVLHHSRPYREEYDLDNDFDDDYQPRPESSKLVYSSKKPKSVRNRLRRPSRMSHQERSRGRPQRRPPIREGERRPFKPEYPRHRYRDEFDEDRDYRLYCKRTGNC